MQIVDVVSHFKGVKKNAEGYMALCPGHNDKNPSLSICEKGDRILLHCFAGCPLGTVLESVDISVEDLFNGELIKADIASKNGEGFPDFFSATKLRVGRSSSIPDEDIAKMVTAMTPEIYRYLWEKRGIASVVAEAYRLGLHGSTNRRLAIPICDASGECRNVRKWLPPNRAGNRKGGEAKILSWQMGHGGTALYPCDMLSSPNLILCEGEMDALALISHGFAAVTSTNGAAAWLEEWTPLFADKKIVIIMDNDREGEQGAEKRASMLSGTAAEIRIVRWPDDRSEAWDVTDELLSCRAGASDEQEIAGIASGRIQMLIDEAVTWPGSSPEPVPEPVPEEAPRKDTDLPRGPIKLSEVPPEDIEWMWYPRIPIGHLTALEGDPGEGKSYITQSIAADASQGRAFFEEASGAPRTILFFSAEDHLGATVRPRIEAMGGDLDKIFVDDDPFGFDKKGFARMRGYLNDLYPGLIVIDPIVNYLPDTVDMHRANEVRGVLKILAGMAAEFHLAVIIVRHLSKGSTSKAIYRGQGSIDFSAACRSVLMAGHDPDDASKKGLAQIKSNLGPLSDPVGYSVADGVFEWTGDTDLTVSRMLAPEGGHSSGNAVKEAREFLREALQDGPKEANLIKKDAKTLGITTYTLRRAKDAMNVVVAKETFAGGWKWSLPT